MAQGPGAGKEARGCHPCIQNVFVYENLGVYLQLGQPEILGWMVEPLAAWPNLA